MCGENRPEKTQPKTAEITMSKCNTQQFPTWKQENNEKKEKKEKVKNWQ